MITVLADDITGAAEIAGIAKRRTLDTILMTSAEGQTLPSADVVVIATDIRSMSRDDATALTRSLCQTIKQSDTLLFKKTDSALRGHIMAELQVIMQEKGFRQSLLIAQNPSKGRVIRGGIYYINGTPLAETAFSYDPEFPAKSSDVTKILGNGCRTLRVEEQMSNVGENNDTAPCVYVADAEETISTAPCIYVADAQNAEDIRLQLAKVGATTLVAGGADLFEAFLDRAYPASVSRSADSSATLSHNQYNKVLAICGSTQSSSLMETDFMRSLSAREENFPDDIIERQDKSQWYAHLTEEYAKARCLILRIGWARKGDARCGACLREIMSTAACEIIDSGTPDLLIIEGGATAFATLSRLAWTTFSVSAEYAPGVVGIRHGSTEIILKPGSYPWGKLFT